MSWCGSLSVHLVWNALCFLDLSVCFLPQIRKVFSHYLFKHIFFPFLLLFSFWNPYNADIGALNVVPGVPYTILIFKTLFSFCCSVWVISTVLSSRLLIYPYVLTKLLSIPSNLFFISFTVFFFSDWFFVTFSNSLLNSYWVLFFSQVCWVSLWPLFWNLYQASYLFSFY